MFREYFVAVACVLMSLEATAQSTIDPADYGGSCLPTSDEVANLIRNGVNKLLASNLQPFTPSPLEASKHALVSALVCKYLFHRIEFAIQIVIRNFPIRSADPETPTLKPNMKWIGWPVAEISPLFPWACAFLPYFYFRWKFCWRIPNRTNPSLTVAMALSGLVLEIWAWDRQTTDDRHPTSDDRQTNPLLIVDPGGPHVMSVIWPCT